MSTRMILDGHLPGHSPFCMFRPSLRVDNGDIRLAETHWYEARGLGRREIKRKRYLD